MSKKISKSLLGLTLTMALNLAFSASAQAQQGPTIPGDFSRPTLQGASSPAKSAQTRTPQARPQSATFTNPNTRHLRSENRAQGTLRRTTEESRSTKPCTETNSVMHYNGAPVYPGPNAPLPTPGTYFYRSPGYGYGPNGYEYQPYSSSYYPNSYQGGGYNR